MGAGLRSGCVTWEGRPGMRVETADAELRLANWDGLTSPREAVEAAGDAAPPTVGR